MKIEFSCNKLKGLLREREITQAEFANSIGLSYSAFSLKITGKRKFSSSEIGAISSVLNIPVDYFFIDNSKIDNEISK